MPTLETILAGVIVVSLMWYALTGGADFGAGIWHLTARGPRAARQRRLIAEAIGPIWEANHVWLIIAVTVLFTAFPRAFAAITTTLHIPLTLMLIGIVLRGSSFALSSHAVDRAETHRAQPVFATSSLITPLWLGVTIGTLASGRMGSGAASFREGFVDPWLAPFPFAVGVFTIALFAYLAAVYLTLEAREDDLRADFRRRALIAWIVFALMAWGVFEWAATGAPVIRERFRLFWWGRPLVIGAAALSVGALAALWTRHFRLARVCAAGQAVLIVGGWALAQFPYLVVPNLTVTNAAAPAPTLRLLLAVLVIGGVILFPALYYLYRIFKGGVILGKPGQRPSSSDHRTG